MQIPDRECSIQVLPLDSAAGCRVINPITGECKSFEAHYILHYDSHGMAYVREDGQQAVQWLKVVLPSLAAFRTGDGKVYILDRVVGTVRWQSQLSCEYETKTALMSSAAGGTSQELSVLVSKMAVPRQGAYMFWCLRDFRQFMDLTLSPKYLNSWLSHQWGAWQAFASEARLPVEQLVRSHASQEARKKLHGDAIKDEFTFQEYSASTCMSLALLSRWACTLQKDGRSKARALLSDILDHTMPASKLYVYIPGFDSLPCMEHSWPVSLQDARHRMEVNNRCIHPEVLLPEMPELKSALARSLWESLRAVKCPSDAVVIH